MTKGLTQKANDMVKEMNTFTYGSMIDNFYIVVSTTEFKQEIPTPDLDKVAEESLRALEKQGATNIIVKTDDFDTQKGISGRRAYGTMTFVDKVNDKSTKLYYEVLIFAQSQGFQQIMIMHEEGDKYGKQVTERVLNSVELETPAQQ